MLFSAERRCIFPAMVSTPIYDFVMDYVRRNSLRFHAAGHKGRGFGGWLGTAYPLDISEIAGADHITLPDGIIAESEANTAALFGTGGAVFSSFGTAPCIHAMLLQMKLEGRTVLAARGADRAFLHTCMLLDLPVTWIFPDSNDAFSGVVTAEAVNAALKRNVGDACVYLTTPDYLGGICDVRKIAKVCQNYGAKLLVDNSNGAHLAFDKVNLHPIALGADLCCDELSKMLPAWTGAACLQCKNPADYPVLRAVMAAVTMDAPSYPVLASIDLCNRYLAAQAKHDVFTLAQRIRRLKLKLSNYFAFHEGDVFHITIDTDRCGMDGNLLAEWLLSCGVAYEYADYHHVVLLCSTCTTYTELEQLERILMECPYCRQELPRTETLRLPHPYVMLPARIAAFSAKEEIPVSECKGRVFADMKPLRNPPIPFVVCGEVLDEQCIALFEDYGIETVTVVRKI